MTEEEARARTRDLVSRETFAGLQRYADLVDEAGRLQNLVSSSTLRHFWLRHILDSVQLAPFIRGDTVDIGAGAGLPGIVLALMGKQITLVEPRRLRAVFLAEAIAQLRLASAILHHGPAATVRSRYDTITARAVAPLGQLIGLTVHLAKRTSRWVLPKGRNAHAELELARRTWHGRFELVPSITDPAAMIVVAEQLKPKASR